MAPARYSRTAVHKQYERRARGTKSILRGRRECYVATALFGENAFETNSLREWRDDCLIKSRMGRMMVFIYYLVSPYCVRFIPVNGPVNSVLRKLVRLVVDVVKARSR